MINNNFTDFFVAQVHQLLLLWQHSKGEAANVQEFLEIIREKPLTELLRERILSQLG